ncbi:sensor histidine kinase [Polaribacter septentrionalilitoris]|uniref:sensor histidine kinase n=1 Tax=Polaribacter septentrionalilitoris TaxID=2494657 RepID=UPI0013590787|nr:histidine kinase [Polaribacter septentrionalilitoris]
MKKIILILIILIGIPFFICSDDNLNTLNYEKGFPNLPKNDNWEYVISRLYPNEAVNNKIGRFEGPILIELHQASKKDSSLIKDIMKDIKVLLPKKEINFLTSFISNYDEKRAKGIIPKNYDLNNLKEYAIQLSFDSINPKLRQEYTHITKIYDKITISNSQKNYNYISNTRDHLNGITNQYLNFEFSNSVSTQERKKIIYYKLLRALVYDFTTFPPNKEIKYNKAVFSRNSSPTNYQLTQMDVFLLQKLYANDFLSQLKSYMVDTYPLNYALNFMSKRDAKLVGLISVILIGLISTILIVFIFTEIDFTNKFFNYLLTVCLIGILSVNLLLLYNYFVEPSSFIHLKNMLIIFFCVSIYFLILSTLFWFLEEKVFFKQVEILQFLGIKILVTLFVLNFPTIVLLFLNYFFHIQFFDNERTIFAIINSLLIISAFIAIIRSVILYLDFQSKSLINKKDIELSRLKEINVQSELKSLQSQINPHFLYNSLNSIASLAPINAEKTQKMAHSLSDLFKYSINRKGQKMSTIKDEIEMVQAYLEIEKIRFEERLNFTIKVDETLLNHKIPLFLIQPLVENAIKHGVSKNKDKGEVVLNIEKETNKILITVTDNGPDFPEGLVSGHGLQTVYDLLRLSYGDKASLNWTNTPQKMITITIPKNS